MTTANARVENRNRSTASDASWSRKQPRDPRLDSCSAPAGVLLDTPAEIKQNAQRVHQQAVTLKAMPLGNVTQMTDAERQKVAAWFAGGAVE